MTATTTAGPDGVHYVVTGTGPGTVVLLHGFSDNLTTWSRVVAPLAVSRRVIAIDLPGFGRSTRRWTQPLCAGYVQAVREVLDAEGVDGPVAFVGNSMGAVVSTLFAAAHPDRTESVVLIDMPGLAKVPVLWQLAFSRPSEFGLRTATRLLPARVAQAGLSLAYCALAAADPRRLEPAVRAGYGAPYADRGGVPAIVPIGRALTTELSQTQLATVVAALPVPVLLVFGGRDLLTPSRVLRRLDPVHRAVVLPGCGHCPQIDQPAALLAHLLPFLADSADGNDVTDGVTDGVAAGAGRVTARSHSQSTRLPA